MPGATSDPETGTSSPEMGTSTAALSTDQCSFFAVNGKVDLCHKTCSSKHPYSRIRVSENACRNAHAKHPGDYVTSTDPNSSLFDPKCKGGGCVPQGAPCDASLPCCDGLTCASGACTPACTLTDLELLALPNGWKATGTCGQFKLFVYDTSNNLLNPGVGTGLSIPLVPGAYAFNLQGDGFDNNGGSGEVPPTLTLFTSCGNAVDLVQGSSVSIGGFAVTVTSFSAARDGDTVSPCAEGPNGADDIAGSVVLTVTAP